MNKRKIDTVSELLDNKVRNPVESMASQEYWENIERYPGPASGWVHATEWLNENEIKRGIRIRRIKEGD